MEDIMQPDNRSKLTGFSLFFVVFSVSVAFLALSVLPAVRAGPAAPNTIYLVTSSSDAAITTCAGGVNDCSLRGAVQLVT
jgi:hypothetical protein